MSYANLGKVGFGFRVGPWGFLPCCCHVLVLSFFETCHFLSYISYEWALANQPHALNLIFHCMIAKIFNTHLHVVVSSKTKCGVFLLIFGICCRMAKMWNDMCMQHNSQLKMVTDLKSIDISQAPKETSKHHHERTIQLWNEIQGWHSQFEKLVTHEKQYIQALNSWLKLNLIPIESSLKEKISSPPRPQHPPIQALLHSWHDSLEKLPHELAKSAISSFAAVIKTIILHQEEEMKLKEKCEETQKEYLRKHQAFQDWYQKYMQRRTPPDETDPEKGDEANPKDPISEKQFVVESLKKKLEEEVEAHQRHCVQVREKSLGSLKLRLPELFRALTDYTHACSDAYQRLKAITQSQSVNGVSS